MMISGRILRSSYTDYCNNFFGWEIKKNKKKYSSQFTFFLQRLRKKFKYSKRRRVEKSGAQKKCRTYYRLQR